MNRMVNWQKLVTYAQANNQLHRTFITIALILMELGCVFTVSDQI